MISANQPVYLHPLWAPAALLVEVTELALSCGGTIACMS
jgi:hypothetical protein